MRSRWWNEIDSETFLDDVSPCEWSMCLHAAGCAFDAGSRILISDLGPYGLHARAQTCLFESIHGKTVDLESGGQLAMAGEVVVLLQCGDK